LGDSVVGCPSPWDISGLGREDRGTCKKKLLLDCFDGSGSAMKETLRAFNNSWASDPAIVSTIITLGHFFHMVSMGYVRPGLPPTTVFPFVVNTMMDALGECTLEELNDYRSFDMFNRTVV
jgi:hypothetical protein